MPQHEHDSRPSRPGGLPLGRLLGVPVRLRPSWLLLAVLVTLAYGQAGAAGPDVRAPAGYVLGAGFVACLLLSVLLHEMGHALASRRLGTGVRGITLELLGGYTDMERDPPRPRVEAAVSLAGPAVSLALTVAAGCIAAALPAGAPGTRLLGQIAVANAIIAVFNLLPGLPLDGGRALHALIWAVTGDQHRGRRVAGYAGLVLAVLLAGTVCWLALAGPITALGVAFGLIMAGTIGTGGAAAVRAGRAGARVRTLAIDPLTRPIFAVPAGTMVAEARRLAAGAGRPDAVLGVLTPDGRLSAVVPAGEDVAVPAERREAVEVEAVARLVEAYRTVPAGLTGDEVLLAVGADPVGDYLVTSGEDVVGILRVADVARVLDPHVRGPRVLPARGSGT
jgi:Zn-dependent protease